MTDWVVDTNVLLVATRAVLGRPPRSLARRGEDVPVHDDNDLETVYLWLENLRRSPECFVVLDVPHDLIKDEYANKLDKNEYGRMVIAEKLSKGQYRCANVARDSNGTAVIPHEAADDVFDLADRKMVSAALAYAAPIVNACDTDWCELEHRGVLACMSVTVHHLLEAWCRTEWNRKRKPT